MTRPTFHATSNRKKSLSVSVMCCLVLLQPLGGSSRAMGRSGWEVDRKPKASGPLEYVGKRCQSIKDQEFRGASTRVCTFWWIFPRTSEIDLEYDYGIVWGQLEVDPGPHCVDRVVGAINLFGGFKWFERAPDQGIATSGDRGVHTRLVSVADGNLLPNSEPGMVQQEWTLRRGELKPSVKDYSIVEIVQWRWDGRSRDKVALSIGVDVQWKLQQGVTWDVIQGKSAVTLNTTSANPKFTDC